MQGTRMSFINFIEKIDHASHDVWKLISDSEKPERWNIFLDSRDLEESKRRKFFYYPTNISSICQSFIEFRVDNISNDDMRLELALISPPLKLNIVIQLFNVNDSTHMRVEAPIPNGLEIDIQTALEEMAKNVSNLCDLLYQFTESSTSENQRIESFAVRNPGFKVSPVKRVSHTQGFSEVISQKSPVIIEDYAEQIPDYQSLKSFEWWRNTFGDQTIQFRRFPSMAYNTDQSICSTTIDTFFKMLEQNPNNQKFAVYEQRIHEVIGLSRYLPTLNFLPPECPITRQNIWIGSTGVKSPMHQDGRKVDKTGTAPDKTHNLNFQVCGSKRVILAHPNQSDFLHLLDSHKYRNTFPKLQFDVFDEIDTNRYPQVANAHFFEAELREGELLYVPRGWWHAFHALSNSINYNCVFSSPSF